MPSNTVGWVIGKQIVKSATSIGANYREACRSRSKAEFISKIAISEGEADETLYWLELLEESQLIPLEIITPLKKEADELTAILVSIGKTAKKNG